MSQKWIKWTHKDCSCVKQTPTAIDKYIKLSI